MPGELWGDSAVAQFAGVPARLYENARFGYLAHFRNLPLHGGIGHAWFLEPDMAYAFPNDDGVTVLAVLPDKKRLPALREDLEGSFFEFVRVLPEAPPVDSAERITKIIGTVNSPASQPQADRAGRRVHRRRRPDRRSPVGSGMRVGSAVRAMVGRGGRLGRNRSRRPQ